MLSKYLIQSFRYPSTLIRSYSMAATIGPLHQAIKEKLSSQLSPTKLEIINESHKHAHHKAMEGVESKETHFKLHVISDSFKGKSLMQRHRLIYQILADEMVDGKVHALSLKTQTEEEIKS